MISNDCDGFTGGTHLAKEMAEMKVQRGFTLPELLVTLAFFMTISAMGFAVMGTAVPMIRTDGQVNRLLGMLQFAREMAISRQRDVEVRIDVNTNTIDLIRHDEGVEVPVQKLVFEYGVKLLQFSDMGDTPEGYGSTDAVDFNGATTLLFISDGSLVDDASVPVNGTIYLAMEGKRETARAITVTGSTARARFYKWTPDSQTWEGGWIGK